MTQFKAGDVVYYDSGSFDSAQGVALVERVTRTQAIDGSGVRYSQATGERIPRGEWNTPKISHRTDRLDNLFFQNFLKRGAHAIRFEADRLFEGDDILARVARLKAAIARFEAASAWTPEQREKFIANTFDQVRHKA